MARGTRFKSNELAQCMKQYKYIACTQNKPTSVYKHISKALPNGLYWLTP